jgi:uncharacterized radical SAM protein YgiQ
MSARILHRPHLPASPDEVRARGWDQPDVLLVSGDAYVDHVSFGTAVVGRLLEHFGLKVAVASQPDWRDPDALAAFGRPRLFVGVSAGNMDSMVNHLTAHRKRRHDDAYSPGGRHGLRPNRATVVYAQLARQAFPDALILLGGVEASLRRWVHYDYWADQLRRSVLVDARADLLVYGMGERPLRAIVDRLAPLAQASSADAVRLYGIRGTGFLIGRRQVESRGLALEEGGELRFGPHGWAEQGPPQPDAGTAFRERPGVASFRVCRLPSHECLAADRSLLAQATRAVERASNPASAIACVQRHGEAFVVLAPPAWPLSTQELDLVHELPFTGLPHPRYEEPVPAAAMIQSSVQITRGCFGGCTFCAIALHEGKRVQSRSRASVLRELARLASRPGFSGVVSDLGGPTANLWGLGCGDPEAEAQCLRPSCLHPRRCPRLTTDHGPLRGLMRAARDCPGVRRVLIASGVRHDLAVLDRDYLRDLVEHHVGGHLHVAPEHVEETVLRLARKPAYGVFERFREVFEKLRRAAGAELYLNPYFVSGLPGSTDARMRALAAALRAEGWRPRQVQSFIPTPGTVATAMFYSGLNPDKLDERVPMPRTLAEKIRQHELLMPTRRR